MEIDGKTYGLLAFEVGGLVLPLRVLPSAAGYYLGTRSASGEPCSRESACYWRDVKDAERALMSRDWPQKRTV